MQHAFLKQQAFLAQDSMRGVVGGLSTRMLALVSQKFTMHW